MAATPRHPGTRPATNTAAFRTDDRRAPSLVDTLDRAKKIANTATRGTRFGRVSTANDAASPAPSGAPPTANARAVVHQAVAATSLTGWTTWYRKLGLDARTAAAITPVSGRSIRAPSQPAIRTAIAPSMGTT